MKRKKRKYTRRQTLEIPRVKRKYTRRQPIAAPLAFNEAELQRKPQEKEDFLNFILKTRIVVMELFDVLVDKEIKNMYARRDTSVMK